MKYLSLVLAFCLTLTIPAIANEVNPTDNVQVTVTAVAEKSVEISLTNLQQQRTSISIQKLDGSVVYYQDIVRKHNGYRKRLNFNELENGKYLLVIEQGAEKHQQVIVLKDNVGMLLSSVK
ncbi:MAG: hypothetical protein ACK4TA_02575 [Saprospiraceae bacterium]